MLKAVSKAAFRVRSADTALSTFKLAVQTALTAPSGPVSVEVPIDIQSALIPMPSDSCVAVPTHVPAAEASMRWPSTLLAPSARCCGWAVARAMPARRSSA